MKKKLIIALVSVALVVCMAVSGTIAYLTSITEPIENVFVLGDDIEIELEEDDEDNKYELTPGEDIVKEATVKAIAGSADMYLFIIITKGDDYDKYLEQYVVDEENWEEVDDKDLDENVSVFYTSVLASAIEDADAEYQVFKDDKIGVGTGFEEIEDGDDVTLTLQAAAIQQATFDSVDEAWAELKKAVNDFNSKKD